MQLVDTTSAEEPELPSGPEAEDEWDDWYRDLGNPVG
jgi:hypothetical protein